MVNNKINANDHQNHNQMRSRDLVMNPLRLGAMHQTRLSFVRSLVRRMAKQAWQLQLNQWQISTQGFGFAIYQLTTPNHDYHLVVFSDQIDDADRNDRVIAEKWDITFALVIGDVDQRLFEQLKNNVPLQEAGRNSTNVIVLARANKSVRVFEHIVETLSQGKQPDGQILAQVGYILRTTAVYGNGKFGIADFEILQTNPDFNLSFSAQMCAVYILRQFSLDWVHDLAKQRGGDNAIELCPQLQRYLGVGNATGLGMTPYLIKHPKVIDNWLSQRENAISLVSQQVISADKNQQLQRLLRRAQTHLQQIVTIDEQQQKLNLIAVQELVQIQLLTSKACQQQQRYSQLLQQNEAFSFEAQEAFIACLLECYPDYVDNFEQAMNADEALFMPKGINISIMLDMLKRQYRWAIEIDFKQTNNQYWFWYRSQDKEEPRLGIRGTDVGEDKELALDIGRQVNRFYHALTQQPQQQTLAEFLLQYPKYAAIARRTWTLGHCDMGDIQMNILAKEALPINLLRCKLAIFGATKFDPRSDRWVRVTLFQGAPLFNDIHADEWLFPLLPQAQEQAI